ncbi:MAG: 16S rRNA (guanine(527)-N(7))-methyltransferase RsmG, partial [Nitrospirae bacterium]|nr:16S rRNA (guanine(527)-N(7))-methyltransferase RsmG [Nitrospirota bacterium]
MQGKKIEVLIENGLRGLGLVPSEWQVNAFVLYLRELKKWNRAYNLTA